VSTKEESADNFKRALDDSARAIVRLLEAAISECVAVENFTRSLVVIEMLKTYGEIGQLMAEAVIGAHADFAATMEQINTRAKERARSLIEEDQG